MSYITKTEFKAYRGISGTGDDDLIDDLIAGAQKKVDNYCHRTFEASADTTRYFDAVDDVDGYTLFLDSDLCAITTITNGDADGTEILSTQYVTEPRNDTPYYAIKLLASSGLAWEYEDDHENAISIEGRWAYSTTADDLIKKVMYRLVAYYYDQRKNAADLDRPIVTGQATVLPSKLPSDIADDLAPYVRLVF